MEQTTEKLGVRKIFTEFMDDISKLEQKISKDSLVLSDYLVKNTIKIEK